MPPDARALNPEAGASKTAGTMERLHTPNANALKSARSPPLGLNGYISVIDLYGDPGTLEGTFENDIGSPTPQRWQGSDETDLPDDWQRSPCNAGNLTGRRAGNHAIGFRHFRRTRREYLLTAAGRSSSSTRAAAHG